MRNMPTFDESTGACLAMLRQYYAMTEQERRAALPAQSIAECVEIGNKRKLWGFAMGYGSENKGK